MTVSDDTAFHALDDGEKSALTLGMALGAELILIDDRKGAAVALRKGFQITGTWVFLRARRSAASSTLPMRLPASSKRTSTTVNNCSMTF